MIFGANANRMLGVAALFWIAIAMQGTAIAQDAKPDTLKVHGETLTLSCAEWKRNQDGSWDSIGALVVGKQITNVTLRGAKETKVLEEKCRNAPSPSVTAPPSGDSPRHGKHKHAPGEAPEGT
jgi:hypothetical protein